MVERSKKVVLKKPKLDMKKQINLTPTPFDSVKKSDPNKRKLEKPLQEKEFIDTNDSEELDIPDETEISKTIPEKQEVLKTSSNRTIIATKIKPNFNLPATMEPTRKPPVRTFDEQFLDNVQLRSTLTNDKKTLEKLEKPVAKSTRIPKSKRKFNLYAIISLIAFILLTIWSYFTLKEYVNSTDTSLITFIYVVAVVILTIMMLVWFIIEIFYKRGKKNEA